MPAANSANSTTSSARSARSVARRSGLRSGQIRHSSRRARPAPGGAVRGRHQVPALRRHQAACHSVAMPWPTPMHMLAAPRAAPRRVISCSRVAVIRAPEQPSG